MYVFYGLCSCWIIFLIFLIDVMCSDELKLLPWHWWSKVEQWDSLKDKNHLAVAEAVSGDGLSQVTIYDLKAVGVKPIRTLENLVLYRSWSRGWNPGFAGSWQKLKISWNVQVKKLPFGSSHFNSNSTKLVHTVETFASAHFNFCSTKLAPRLWTFASAHFQLSGYYFFVFKLK